MKKTIAIVAVLAAALSLASAKSLGLTLGVHGTFGWGLGKSWSSNIQDSIDTATNNGATAEDPFTSNMLYGGGAYVNIPLVSALGLQPEVNFMVNNAGYTSTDSGSSTILGITTAYTSKVDSSVKYSSVDIPVFLSVKFKKFNFLVGTYIPITVSQLDMTTDSYATTTIGSSTTETDPDPFTASYDIASSPLFGMAFGFDYINRIGLARLVTGVRYMLDFTPVTIKIDDDTQEVFTRRALTANLGVCIPL